MAKDNNIIDVTENVIELAAAPEAEPIPDTLVEFKKPYRFEDKEYTEVDLAGLEDLSTKDMIEAEKRLARSGVFTPLPEMNINYVCIMAAKAAKLPVEFFEGLPPREMEKFKNKVTIFFYGEE